MSQAQVFLKILPRRAFVKGDFTQKMKSPEKLGAQVIHFILRIERPCVDDRGLLAAAGAENRLVHPAKSPSGEWIRVVFEKRQVCAHRNLLSALQIPVCRCFIIYPFFQK